MRLSDDLVAAKSELMLRLNDYFGFSSPDVSRAFVMIDNSVLSSLEEMLGLVERHDLVKSENGDGHPPSSEQVGDGVARGVDYCVSLIELDGISQSHGYLGSEYDVAEAKSLLARSAFRDKVRELFGFDRRLWDDASWLVGLVRCVTESAMDKMDKLKNQVGGKPAKEPVEWCQCGRFLGERGADK